MNINNYLIHHQEFDWMTILADWVWILPAEEFTLWLMNRYGDLFIVTNDEAVHLLDICGGLIEKIADNRDDFCRLLDENDNCSNWLMIHLVDKVVASGKLLKEGRCYSLVIPPMLGGTYTVKNTSDLCVEEHFSFYAYIHQQIKDLPDGARVRFKIET